MVGTFAGYDPGDGLSGEPSSVTTTTTRSSSEVKGKDKGSYADTAKGREQSGTSNTTSTQTAFEEIDYKPTGGSNHLTRDTDTFNNSVEVTYSPTSRDQTGESDSTRKRFGQWEGETYEDITIEYKNGELVNSSTAPSNSTQGSAPATGGGDPAPQKSSGPGGGANSFDVNVKEVTAAFLESGGHEIAPMTVEEEIKEIHDNNSNPVTYGGETRRIAYHEGFWYVFDLAGNWTGEFLTYSKSAATSEETRRFTETEDNVLVLDNGISTRDLALEAVGVAKVGKTVQGVLNLIPDSIRKKIADGAKKLGSNFSGSKAVPDVKAGKAAAVPKTARPGSVSGNPANRMIEVPTKNGTLVSRHVRITAEDAERYRWAQADRYDQLLNETPSGLDRAASEKWRFDQMNAFRRAWLDNFYKSRDY